MSKIKQKRDKYFKFRLMFSEIEELQKMAQAENLDPSKFVRSRIFSHKRAVAQLWNSLESDGELGESGKFPNRYIEWLISSMIA